MSVDVATVLPVALAISGTAVVLLAPRNADSVSSAATVAVIITAGLLAFAGGWMLASAVW